MIKVGDKYKIKQGDDWRELAIKKVDEKLIAFVKLMISVGDMEKINE